ncbi:MAG: hypothetical protein ACRDQ5_13980, partial [Sciscionella sp.]
MAEIVLVHGIGQEQRSADSLESEWLPALAGGVRTAGADRCADELWRHARPGQRDVRMAFYGDLFRVDGRQGGLADELTDAQWALAEPLATQWLARSAQRASRASDRATAERELAALEPTGEVQGMAAALRPVLRSVARSRPFARLGVGLAERFVLKAL